MRSEANVQHQVGNHARLFRKRTFDSQPRTQKRDLSPLPQDHILISSVLGGPESTADMPAAFDNFLAAEVPSSTSEATSHPNQKSSTRSGFSTQSPTSTPSPEAKSGSSKVSGMALGIVFALLGLSTIIMGIVWYTRRRRGSKSTHVARWKRKPFEKDPRTETSEKEAFVGLPNHSNKSSEGYARLKDEKNLPPLSSMTEKVSMFSDTHSSFLAQSIVIAPPTSTFNNSSRPLSAVSLERSSKKTGELAKVHRAFLPTLPDELQIQQGEMIEIISSFDDGWTLCMNRQGHKGVVPLECLSLLSDKKERGGLGVQETGDGNQSRLSKRASSLYTGATSGNY